MKLPVVPFGTTTPAAFLQWLRVLVASITAGWRVEHSADGRHDWHETAISPFAATNFAASSSTWTVDSADVTYYHYAVLGSQMTLSFRVASSDVGAGNAHLRLSLPTGYSVARYSAGFHAYNDAAAGWDIGQIVASPGDRYLKLFTRPATNWTSTSSDNTSVEGSILLTVTKD